ncbi:MAG: glutamyl-tRNA reductase [Planctomycetaceae bacterium]|nr:glutamyl-tRNA reductase [Planctomycetales bacterium]MCB9940948.1 glutamyl-tRNA reductase [Planctomycetaceae bacterium]
MKLQVVGCSHHNASVEMRERLAFSPEQARDALSRLRQLYPDTETVVLSTCNRVELYFAAESAERFPSHHDVVEFLAQFHGLDPIIVFNELFERTGEDAIRHLFTVAGSLDSMVVGEAQILPQVKEAYERATADDATGPLTHAAFQAAIRVAKRVANETAINQKRVSVPSVAVGDFAKQFFERFDDKEVLLIGAGEMGEETLRYLIDEGAKRITIINRSPERARELANRIAGEVAPWSELKRLLVKADLVVTTTGATEPIITVQDFRQIHHDRAQHPIFILDLAIPRDFAPAVSEFAGVYLYCIDDLKETCQSNQRAREKEWPKAERIIEDETAKFMAELHHRATGPTIRRLKEQADRVKADELARLLKKLPDIDEGTRAEITQTLNRVVNKLLHPPLESLRDEAHRGSPHGLVEALKRLFQLKD